MTLDWDGRASTAHIPVREAFFAAGTRRVRTAVLATVVDVVAGHAPEGPVGPTVDLRLQIDSDPPTDGRVHLVSRPLRVGTRFVVGQTELRGDGGGPPFARATTTFLNNRIGDGLASWAGTVPPMPEACFDELVRYTVVDDRTLEWHPDPRVMIHEGTVVQGGAQALFAELAAQHALAGGRPMVAADLDVRYLGRLRDGPLVALVQPVARQDGRLAARVVLTNRDGERDGIVAFADVTLAPAA
jgi:acyl-coenzyme A thioesterase PaaI-like protein